jgi:hypothetical protein
LIQNSEASRDLRDLAWTKLALDAYRGQDECGGSPFRFDYVPEALTARIESAYQERAGTNWCLPSPVCEALAALALSPEQKNYFRMAETEVNQTRVDAAPPPRYWSWPRRVQSFLHTISVETTGLFRQAPQTSAVHISSVHSYGTKIAVYMNRQYDSFCNQVPLQDRRVVIKVNLVDFQQDRAIHTHPMVVASALELCREWKVADVRAGDDPLALGGLPSRCGWFG